MQRHGGNIITSILILLVLCSLGLSTYIVLRQFQTPSTIPTQEVNITPLPLPKEPSITPKNIYVCPETEWIDCMPGPDKDKRKECTEPFLTWAKTNCPNFQGAAY